MSGSDDRDMIPGLATFQLGEAPRGLIALLLGYATKQSRPPAKELESFVICMSRDQAKHLADALIRLAVEPPSSGSPQRRH